MSRLLRRILVLLVALLVVAAPGRAPAAYAAPITHEAVAAVADPIQGGAPGDDVVVDVDDETSSGDDIEAPADDDADSTDDPAAPIATPRPPVLPAGGRTGVRRAIVGPRAVHLEIPKPPPRA